MTAFALTAEQHALSDEVRDLAARELRPIADDGEPGRVNRELIRTMARFGLLDRVFPGVAEGGPRLISSTGFSLIWEALATESTQAGTALAMQGIGSYPLLAYGQQEQILRWLPAVAAGDAVPSFALAESAGGTDPGALSLAAGPDADGWRLTGEKTWIYNAPEADFYAVFARTGPDPGADGVSAFLVPAIRPGLSGEHLEMVGPHPVGTLAFDDVPVTADDLLGSPGQGYQVATSTLQLFRPSVGAFAVGMAQAALEAAVAHATAEASPGKRLSEQQAIAHLLADMVTKTEAARLLVYAAAAATDALEDRAAGLSAMARLLATETAQFVVDAAVQVHGTSALRRGHLLEHLYREVRAPRVYEGATGKQRSIIAATLYP